MPLHHLQEQARGPGPGVNTVPRKRPEWPFCDLEVVQGCFHIHSMLCLGVQKEYLRCSRCVFWPEPSSQDNCLRSDSVGPTSGSFCRGLVSLFGNFLMEPLSSGRLLCCEVSLPLWGFCSCFPAGFHDPWYSSQAHICRDDLTLYPTLRQNRA